MRASLVSMAAGTLLVTSVIACSKPRSSGESAKPLPSLEISSSVSPVPSVPSVPSVPPSPEPTWASGTSEFEGLPLFMRVRTTIATVPDPVRTTKLTVRWDYGGGGFDGLPPTEVLEPLDAFEVRLVASLERDGASIEVAVATTGGAREWIFYTTDIAECQRRFQAEFGKDPQRYPVKLTTVEDPGWAEYKGIVGRFGR